MKKFTTIAAATILWCALLPARAQNITTFAGNGVQGFSPDGTAATACEFNYPGGLFLTSTGYMYVTDDSNTLVRVISPAGVVSTVAGTGTAGYSGDGLAATDAQLNQPWKVVLDRTGNMYISDVWNQVIRKVNAAGIISTYAGYYNVGAYYGDGGPASSAFLDHPVGIAVDRYGDLFIGDVYNNVIRKVDTTGIITTVAGNYSLGGGSTGDGGQATNAQLNLPYGIAVDSVGNLYIGDAGNNKIRMVNTSGIITTIAGTGTIGYTGDGGQATNATLSHPMEVLLTGDGGMYISDVNNDVVRFVDVYGKIKTVAGNGTKGYSGDGGPATAAEMYYPVGMVINSAGTLFLADEYNMRIRELVPAMSTGISAPAKAYDVAIMPNPAPRGAFTIKADMVLTEAAVDIYNVIGEKVYATKMSGTELQINLNQPDGMYVICISSQNSVWRKQFNILNN